MVLQLTIDALTEDLRDECIKQEVLPLLVLGVNPMTRMISVLIPSRDISSIPGLLLDLDHQLHCHLDVPTIEEHFHG